MNLDPPGASGPFDALKYPEALIARLNPVPNDPDGLPHGWSDEALKKVPRHILANLPVETLAALPESFRSSLPRKILVGDKMERPERPRLAAASRLTHRSQCLLTVEEAAPTEDLAEPPTSQTRPATSRLSRRSYPQQIPAWDTKDSLIRPLRPTTWDVEEDPTHPIIPAIGNVDSLSQLSPSMEEETSRGDMREPSTSSLIQGMCRWQSRSKVCETRKVKLPPETGKNFQQVRYLQRLANPAAKVSVCLLTNMR
jgi:hypothetical protein